MAYLSFGFSSGPSSANRRRDVWSESDAHFFDEQLAFFDLYHPFGPTNGPSSQDGLFGTTFGLLNDVFNLHAQPVFSPLPTRASRLDLDAGMAYGDDSLMFGRASASRCARQDLHQRSSSRAPASSTHRTTYWRESEGRESARDCARMIADLKGQAQYHRQEQMKFYTKLERGIKPPKSSLAQLQAWLDAIRCHEKAESEVDCMINFMEEEMRKRSYQEEASQSPHQARRKRQVYEDDVGAPPSRNLHSRPRRYAEHVYAYPGHSTFESPFAAFDRLDPELDPSTAAFHNSVRGNRFASSQGAHGRTSTPPKPRRRAFAGGDGPAPQPSTFVSPQGQSRSTVHTLPTLQEAQRMFQLYCDRWNALAPTDPNVPYPSRNLTAASLDARNTILAPHVRTPVTEWSRELVVKANVQAFFLLSVGLSPHISETTGTRAVELGFDQTQATPRQVKELTGILKKERLRWHSDRLGRRNGGISAGPNKALERNQTARAVFHAVCELMETVR